MRIFLAGATGVIGVRLVPLLVAAGHTIGGLTRREAGGAALRVLGAEPFVGDVYDRGWLRAAVTDFAAEVVLHELTDLPDERAEIASYASANARIRLEGTRNLLDAAQAAGAARFLAQRIAWTPPGDGGVTGEFEAMVLAAGGVVLRYGQLYGPGTYFPEAPPPRIHADAAAARTVALLGAPSGVVTLTEEG
ncbi:MAG TPA: NAD-dependent epimerase/dehydratase family protein [Acidimicrobiales bacterium]|nr:NAD-dependent epimerase/dehydratase family protein [Acidimicrobiales bacterium]